MALPRPHKFDDDGDGSCVECTLPAGNARHLPDPADDTTGRVLGHVDRPSARVGHRHPATSQDAAVAALPRSGTIRALLYFRLLDHPSTDDEMEVHFERPHQSISASRNSLMRDGLIEPLLDDDGQPVTRRTRSGNDAMVWTPTAAARALTGAGVAVP